MYLIYFLNIDILPFNIDILPQPRSQHCLSKALVQSVSFWTLIGCNLNDESVRKTLKTQL